METIIMPLSEPREYSFAPVPQEMAFGLLCIDDVIIDTVVPQVVFCGRTYQAVSGDDMANLVWMDMEDGSIVRLEPEGGW